MKKGGDKMAKKREEISIRSSAAEYLTYVATVGDQQDSIEMRYEDKNIWLTQKMMDTQYRVCRGDAIFVPAGTWHNVINVGRESLKVSSIYAPPHHRRGTVQPTRLDAKREEM